MCACCEEKGLNSKEEEKEGDGEGSFSATHPICRPKHRQNALKPYMKMWESFLFSGRGSRF